MPEPVWGELTSDQRSAILRHELAHYRRGDLWKLLAARVLALVHWFNPLVWWAVRRFAECAEWACDRAAAGSRQEDMTEYAKALLRLSAVAAPCGVHGTAMRGGSLFHRIRRLVSARTSEDTVVKKAVLLSVVLGLVAVGSIRLELVAKGRPPEDRPTIERLTPDVGFEPAEQTDLHGDLLPEGALARMGSLRLRHGGERPPVPPPLRPGVGFPSGRLFRRLLTRRQAPDHRREGRRDSRPRRRHREAGQHGPGPLRPDPIGRRLRRRPALRLRQRRHDGLGVGPPPTRRRTVRT